MKALNAKDKTRVIVAVSLLSAVILVLFTLVLTGRLTSMWQGMWQIFKGRDELRAYMESWGSWAPVAFIVLQALQVVVAPIPGELTGAVGGFVFGGVPNIIYSTAGLTIGSVVAFLAARVMGLPLVKLAVSPEMLDKFRFLTERRGTILTLILFAIPGFPKDIFCYILGLSPMRFVPFVVVCAVGRLPGTVLLSFGGSAAYDENWRLLLVVSVIGAACIGVFFLWRSKIHQWLKRMGGERL